MKTSKYNTRVSRELRALGDEPKPLSRCQRCGWCFKVDNDLWRSFDKNHPTRKRKEPRTEIRLTASDGTQIVRCDVCYETELMGMHKHTKQGHEGLDLYVRGLRAAERRPEERK